MTRTGWLICLCLSFPIPAFAVVGTPGPGYFHYQYERIGRGSAPGHTALNDVVLLTPFSDQRGMIVTSCDPKEDIRLSFGPAFEQENLMTGGSGTASFDCLFFHNGRGRPILTCRGNDGTAFTLWPKSDPLPLACAAD